ncbi:hypothetical protein [Vagococcus acidifermentans]|uniref:Uncharacterized protein n=1 Tax=Vagococcus acidifermentans TaxID=564710 RepID=A0A430AUN7_9ENTE|nr:hypothetical protein [Vagococcus acidifermentans]RSU11773.1 hypothetical protein CBF27_07385 [Vagococcus acidifermentans]
MGFKNEGETVIPKFSIKSAFLLFLSGLVGGVALPYLFYILNLKFTLAILFFLPLCFSLSLGYSMFFIETKSGFCKRFWITTICSFVVLTALAYIWLFKGIIF